MYMSKIVGERESKFKHELKRTGGGIGRWYSFIRKKNC
jgi:hypothetical protein